MEEIINTIFEDGLKGAGMVFILVCCYKIYKMKISTETDSNCSKCFSMHVRTSNPGGSLPMENNVV